MSEKDYYKILGLGRDATDAQIKDAYRKLAKKYHPDLYSSASAKEKATAEEKFKEIGRAYECLSTPEKKSAYDRFGTDDPQMAGMGGGFWRTDASGFGGGGMGGFEDIVNNIFGSFGGMGGAAGGGTRQRATQNGPTQGDDISVQMTISFNEAAFGCQKEITVERNETCVDCKGTGARGGTAMKTCSKCGGSGNVRFNMNTPLGPMQSNKRCDECNGKGFNVTESCGSCHSKGVFRRNRTISVKIPAGIDSGQMMNYKGQGHAGKNGGPNGNVVIVINVRPHKLFTRRGDDLYIEMPITMTQAALGCKLTVPTLDSQVTYSIAEGTQTGTQFRLKGHGIKHFKKENGGDLYVKIIVEIPRSLADKDKSLLRTFESNTGGSNYPMQKAFIEACKSSK
jgi:molecular chaperone DnaJ